ncbi:Helix-turn-helix transcriptional regulator, partial [Dysosmobacter welbionis]
NESRILRVFCKVPSLIVPWLIARYSASSFLKMLLNSFMTKTTFLPENRQMYLLLPVQGVRSPEAAQC